MGFRLRYHPFCYHLVFTKCWSYLSKVLKGGNRSQPLRGPRYGFLRILSPYRSVGINLPNYARKSTVSRWPPRIGKVISIHDLEHFFLVLVNSGKYHGAHRKRASWFPLRSFYSCNGASAHSQTRRTVLTRSLTRNFASRTHDAPLPETLAPSDDFIQPEYRVALGRNMETKLAIKLSFGI